VLLHDGSFREWLGSRFGRERALHRPYRSLDRLGRLRFVSCCIASLVRPLGRLRPSLVCWLGAIFSVNILFGDSAGERLVRLSPIADLSDLAYSLVPIYLFCVLIIVA
jgi:hypothetical protein